MKIKLRGATPEASARATTSEKSVRAANNIFGMDGALVKVADAQRVAPSEDIGANISLDRNLGNVAALPVDTAAARADPVAPVHVYPRPEHLATILRRNGAVDPDRLLDAVAMQARQECSLPDVLLAHDWVCENDLRRAEEELWNARHIDLRTSPPDARLVARLGTMFCLKYGIIPWRQLGGTTVYACARPQHFEAARDALGPDAGDISMALCATEGLHDALLQLNQKALAFQAEACVPPSESVRTWNASGLRIHAALALCVAVILAFTFPKVLWGGLYFWAVLTLVAFTILKVTAALKQLTHRSKQARKGKMPPQKAIPARLPRVSIMVPLFREKRIAEKLIRRLSKLEYPRELLEICLVCEADDIVTRNAVASTQLPFWIRAVTVPAGELRTKPRALNFAMDFCSGSIIGVYDAEDAPDPDQIHKIVRRFHERGPEVACLQGILDYYNAHTNWLSRCFTIEYATWFRVVLPGIMRLGFAIPLGGTTLFFRRAALEKLGRWDAHNVTEDADLGIRLARHGYRAELIETVTREEANCRAVPWIKQRSRWLKGYAATWAVHMREPRTLFRQLGAWKFLGFQIMFFCTLSQFVLAPLLWSFWLVPLGFGHPLDTILPGWGFLALGMLFLLSEAASITVGVFALSEPEHRFLRWWVPTLQLYYPLGAIASYKGLWELLQSPFYWDKTSHGHFDPTEAPQNKG